MHHHHLTLLPDQYAVCRFDPETAIPEWATRGEVFCIMRTREELSILCAESFVPADGVLSERGWRAFKLTGPFEFSMTGVMTSVLNPLAEAAISIFAISTYDTDYVLVKADQAAWAIDVLWAAGHTVDA